MPTIPVPAAAAIAARLGVELPPELQLRMPLRAGTEDELRRALAAGIDTARAAGLLTVRGVDPALHHALRLLANPGTAVHLIHGHVAARRDRAVYAVADDRRALLAEVRAGALALTDVRPTALAAELAATLPLVPAAGGPRSATAPRDAVQAALQAAGGLNAALPGALAAELAGRGVHAGDARLIADALTARRTAVAQVYVGPTTTMDVLDTDRGRYVATARGDHVVIAPGRPDVVRAKIDELITATRGSPRTPRPAATP